MISAVTAPEVIVANESVMTEGDMLRSMVIGSKDWVHRKVQRYGYAVPGMVRVETTLDLTPHRRLVIKGSRNHVILPISLVMKGALLAFDITSPTVGALSVLRAEECTKYAQKMMESVLESAQLPLKPSGTAHNPWAFIDCPPEEAEHCLADFQQHLATPAASLQALEIVMQLARQLALTRLLLVEFPASVLGERCLVAYSYALELESRPGMSFEESDGYQFKIEDPGFASSLHQEVMTPAELEAISMFVEFTNEKGEFHQASSRGEPAKRIAHVYSREIPRFSQASLEFELRPIATGLFNFTGLSLAIVGLLTAFMLIVRIGPTSEFLRPDWLETNSAGVVLAGPAILLSWLARVPEHAVVTRALTKLRMVNALLAGSLLAVAAAVSISWQPPMWNATWLLSYMLYAAALVLGAGPLFNRAGRARGAGRTGNKERTM